MKKILTGIACVLFWLIVWQIGAVIMDEPILLVSPFEVAKRLTELITEADFIKSIMFSLGRILLGFLLGLFLGTALAALAAKINLVRKLFAPLISVMKSIPVASFTILAIIWVGSKNLSVLVSVLIAIPIIYSNMLEGIDSLDPKLKEMAEIFKIPPVKRFFGIYMSQILPYFRSASRLAMGLCWKSGVAAEVIGIPDGSIGERLYMSKIYLETEDLFAWTIIIILLSFICERLFIAVVDLIKLKVERM